MFEGAALSFHPSLSPSLFPPHHLSTYLASFVNTSCFASLSAASLSLTTYCALSAISLLKCLEADSIAGLAAFVAADASAVALERTAEAICFFVVDRRVCECCSEDRPGCERTQRARALWASFLLREKGKKKSDFFFSPVVDGALPLSSLLRNFQALFQALSSALPYAPFSWKVARPPNGRASLPRKNHFLLLNHGWRRRGCGL